MPSVFLTSDTHFGHTNICVFKNPDGSKVRPWDSAEEMNEEMVQRWNDTVRPNDKVYHLGDVVINKKHLSILNRLNGDKVLIKGNHDIFKLNDYTQYFRDVRGYHVMNGMILSHIPVHPSSLTRFGTNIHGHLHSSQVMKTKGFWPFKREVVDPRYLCVCVEHTDFKPILFEDVIERIKQRGGHVGFKNGNFSKID